MQMELQLTPQAYKAVEQEFDVRRGYAKQLIEARRVFQRRAQMKAEALGEAGFIKFAALSGSECPDLCARIREELDGGTDRTLALEILARVFTPEIDREIISYFGSEYAPIEAGFFETRPDEPVEATDAWHCGAGPSRFLRVMVCLTGSAKDGPATLFCERPITAPLKEAGYVYCQLENRVVDLNSLTDALGLERAVVVEMDVEPGDTIIFDSPGILHRRLLPKHEPRYVMAATLIPTMISWRQVTDAGVLPLPPGTGFPPLPGFAEEG